jgi:hypothetical protein
VPKGYGVKKVKDTQVEGDEIQRKRGKGFKVLQQQGLKDKTLGERGSLRCFLSKASCSLLLPGKHTSSKTSKIKTREFKEGECCKGKALSSNPKRKMTLGVDNLGLDSS